jgi:hypothetical protein
LKKDDRQGYERKKDTTIARKDKAEENNVRNDNGPKMIANKDSCPKDNF